MMRAILVGLAILAGANAAAQLPPRDTPGQARTGAASITGVVVSDERQPKPLRRARVTLNSPELPYGRTEITNDDGTFAFRQLPPGRYRVGATKDAYLHLNYGAVRAGRPGTPIVLRQGESHDVTLRLTRGSVITGSVVTNDGQPARGIPVAVLAMNYVPEAGERRPQPSGAATATTDDRGAYRIFGLQPGEYMVAAIQQRQHSTVGEVQRLTEAEIRRALSDVRETATRSMPGIPTGSRTSKPPPPPARPRPVTYAPVYFPGTTNAGLAARVTLGKSEERTGVDITMDLVPTARVSGVAHTQPEVQGVSVAILPAPGTAAFDGGFRSLTNLQADGSFAFRAVPPGHYIVAARGTTRPGAPGGRAGLFTASSEVIVDGDDIGNVILTLERGITISGQVVFEGTRAAPDLSAFRIALPQTISTGAGMTAPLPPLQIDGTGRFSLEGVVPGIYRLGTPLPGTIGPIGAWWLKSVAIDGRELLDAPLEFRQSTDRAVVTFSDRASTVSGVAVDKQGNPAPDTHVVIFSADRRAWFYNSRRVVGVRTDAGGRYLVRNLPPGDYLIVATADVEPREWFDPVVLERFTTGSIRVTLGEYEVRAQDVVVR